MSLSKIYKWSLVYYYQHQKKTITGHLNSYIYLCTKCTYNIHLEDTHNWIRVNPSTIFIITQISNNQVNLKAIRTIFT